MVSLWLAVSSKSVPMRNTGPKGLEEEEELAVGVFVAWLALASFISRVFWVVLGCSGVPLFLILVHAKKKKNTIKSV